MSSCMFSLRNSSGTRIPENFTYGLFHDGGPYHTETSPSICKANQWTGFYMIETSVMTELMKKITAYFRKSLKKMILVRRYYKPDHPENHKIIQKGNGFM